MKIRTKTEAEARQLAARYFAQHDVQIVAGHQKGEECCYLEADSDKGLVRPQEYVLFQGLGKDAAALDEPLAWSASPKWKRGLWLRRTATGENIDAPPVVTTQVLEWDGLGETPDVELADAAGQYSTWLGPLPPLPF